MNVVDLVVLALVVLAALSGWRQGSVTSVLAFAGVVLGAVVGVRVAPSVVGLVSGEVTRLAVGLAVVIGLVVLGETVGVVLGRAVRGHMRLPALRTADSALGSVVQALAVLVAAWLVAIPLSSAASVGLAAEIRSSRVLGSVDGLLPVQAQQLPAELGNLFDTSGLPDVLGPFGRTPVAEVAAPDPALQSSALVEGARSSVLKVRGVAPSCQRGLEGSGFVVAPERVVTNAHVVAGTTEVAVESDDGTLPGRVVLYDPSTDLAVLDVPGLTAPALAFAPDPATAGESAVVLGYPLDGPYTASPARVREDISLRGPDIYESSTVVRDVYTVRGQVRSGNSGGPLVDADGQVLGVVFGASIDDPETGFVLTAGEVSDEVAAAPGLSTQVSTGSCTA
ncbi:MarP family serine protease [Rhodococcus aerolatus]